ncbi:MAG: transcriptional repressor [Thermoguttaceae bacterium]|nr:transcriptional repressor [Thermoguttaceae bacterium]
MEQFKKRCHELNLAATPQRVRIYEYVTSVTTHPSADQVYEVVREVFPTISRTSVYRILDTFARHDLIKRLVHPGTAVRYDGNTKRHFHLYCTRCNTVFDLFRLELFSEFSREAILEAAGDFNVLDYSVVFTGICSCCQTADQPKKE